MGSGSATERPDPGAAVPDRNVPRDAIAKLGPWFHNLHLPDGRQTRPDHPLGDFPSFKWQQIAPYLPDDMAGMRALDIGCNAGFYSFQLAARGAEVLGVDIDDHYLAQARWAAREMGVADRVAFERRSVYSLVSLPPEFDVVLFMGVLYHLRHPLLGLDVVTRLVKPGGQMVVQSLTMPGDAVEPPIEDEALQNRDFMLREGWPKMAFIEHRLAGDPTNWWAPNGACLEAMLRTCGMSVRDRPGHEIYLCTPDHPRDPDTIALVRDELVQVFGEVE